MIVIFITRAPVDISHDAEWALCLINFYLLTIKPLLGSLCRIPLQIIDTNICALEHLKSVKFYLLGLFRFAQLNSHISNISGGNK